MINEIKGDLLTAKGIILHGVNCQGVMGSGVAYAIRMKWPLVYQQYLRYVAAYRPGQHLLGMTQYVPVDETVEVVNCFTQEFYGRDGKRYASYDALDRCMTRLSMVDRSLPINFPKIGCGLGGLDWNVVKEIIDSRIPDTFEKNLWILK